MSMLTMEAPPIHNTQLTTRGRARGDWLKRFDGKFIQTFFTSFTHRNILLMSIFSPFLFPFNGILDLYMIWKLTFLFSAQLRNVCSARLPTSLLSTPESREKSDIWFANQLELDLHSAGRWIVFGSSFTFEINVVDYLHFLFWCINILAWF